jgi:HSP20 family protein
MSWPGFFEDNDDFISPFEAFFNTAEKMGENIWSPRVDILEKNDSWVFKAEVPDVKPEEIAVTIEDGVLSIKGERKFEEEVNEGSFTRFERQYGSFERRFSLPKNINDGDVKADYRNGILTLTVPKTEEAKPKSIKIDVN